MHSQAPTRRRDDPRLLSGNGRYLDDLVLPDMLHMAVLRSPHAHARILGIDAAAVRARPGVRGVVTVNDLGAIGELPVLFQPTGVRQTGYPVLPQQKVLYVGQPVAAVSAQSRYAAEDAVEGLAAEYDPLPAVVDVEQAMVPDAPRLYEDWPDNVVARREILVGDPEAALAAAPVIVEATFTLPRHSASPLEGRGAVARYDPQTGELTLWVSNQAPHQYRTQLAAVLGLDEYRIRVVVPDVGGGFGAKLHFYPEEVLACLLAMRTGRPVKWVEDRREHFLSMVHAREQRVRVTAGFDRDGRLLAMDAHVRGDVGAHLHTKGAAPIFVTGMALPGPYAVRHYRARVEAVVTNKVPFGAYRGFGMQQSTFVTERLMDLAAARLGQDVAEIRRRNLIPRDAFPYRSAGGYTYDSGDYEAVLDRALELSAYPRLRALQRQRRTEGRFIGIGLCSYVEFSGMGPSQIMGAGGNRQGGYETAVLRLDTTGRLTLSTGLTELGQGIRGSLAQIAAGTLGLPPDEVHVVLGDTHLCPYSSYGTAASRGSVVGGAAVLEASRLLREKVLAIAAFLLEARAEDLDLADVRCVVRGAPGRSLTVAEVAREAYRGQRLPSGMEPGLETRFTYHPPNWVFPYGVHIAAVELDPLVGTVEFLGYWVAHDCGTIINPTLVDGQLHGGIAQGVGAALLEALVYDRAGQLLSTTFMDYLLPTAAEMPVLTLHHIETPSPVTPGGMKGMAEGGTIAAPAAIANAVADALAGLDSKCAAGVTFYPLGPAQVQALIRP